MSQLDDSLEALQEITQASGTFSRDPNEHARNCIRDMQAIVIHVLRKHGYKPPREDDPIDGKMVPPNDAPAG
jgi:hypothetical protein